MIFSRPLCLALLLLAGMTALRSEEPAAAAARTLAREAVAAAQAKDYPLYLSKMEAAVALRPDYPRMLVNLAGAQALNDQPDAAIATLKRLAALGVHSPVAKSEEFSTLRDRADFKAVCAQLAANMLPAGPGELAFTVPGMTGLIEGIAWREKTGEFFFGDVHTRGVWARTPDGKVRRFSPDDPALLGVFGLAVDEANGALWAATSAVTAMRDYTAAQDGVAGVAEFELASGKLRRVVLLPADGKQHVLGDLALAPDGSVLLPDSVAAVLWRLAPGGTTLEPFVESPEFMSLQGAVITPDGKSVILSDYANGLLKVDLVTRSLTHLAAPPDTTLLGIDGLALAPDGTLLAVQNGVRPLRILRLTLDAAAETVTQVKVLESGHITMADPTLGCIAAGQFVFVGNAGWSRFEGEEIKPTDPRPIPIFHTKFADPPAAKPAAR